MNADAFVKQSNGKSHVFRRLLNRVIFILILVASLFISSDRLDGGMGIYRHGQSLSRSHHVFTDGKQSEGIPYMTMILEVQRG
jgi:hypothetical protein